MIWTRIVCWIGCPWTKKLRERIDELNLELRAAQAFAKDGYAQFRRAQKQLEAIKKGSVN